MSEGQHLAAAFRGCQGWQGDAEADRPRDGADAADPGVRRSDEWKSGARQKSGAAAPTITKGLPTRATGNTAGGVLPGRDRPADAVGCVFTRPQRNTPSMTLTTYAKDLAQRAQAASR